MSRDRRISTGLRGKIWQHWRELLGAVLRDFWNLERIDMAINIKERAAKLKSDIPAVFIAMKDKDTPVIAKVFAGLAVAYALSPIDLIPGFIPVLGYLDDVIILPAMVALTIKYIPKNVWERSRKAAEGMWKDGKPKKWYYAIPIIVFWGIILWLIIKNFLMN